MFNKVRIRSWYPLERKWKWFWVAFLLYMPISAAWLFLHGASYAVFHGTLAAVVPVLVFLRQFRRQRNWQYLALAIAYPLFSFSIVVLLVRLG